MATPTRATIVAAINTALSAISTSSGYKTDVTTVENLIRDWQDVTATLRPWLRLSGTYTFWPLAKVTARLS